MIRLAFRSLLAASFWFAPQWAAGTTITIETVFVQNTGLPHANSLGHVNYDYSIGTTEVTNAQYAVFLNAKAASDPLGLYNSHMASDERGGIVRSGSNGSYTYSVKSNMGNKPVNWVSWYDAARFTNWLHNGQGSGDTENGSYTLRGGTPVPISGFGIDRNPDATWALPTGAEWYKSAYYDPTLPDGEGDYWTYATRSNAAPTPAEANAVGDISNPGPNVVNYVTVADWNGENGNVTTVGSAGPLSKSYYGTSDQNGNVAEWSEQRRSTGHRGAHGGTYSSHSSTFLSSDSFMLGHDTPANEQPTIGFRVVHVPEASSWVLALWGLAGFAEFVRRSRPRSPFGRRPL